MTLNRRELLQAMGLGAVLAATGSLATASSRPNRLNLGASFHNPYPESNLTDYELAVREQLHGFQQTPEEYESIPPSAISSPEVSRDWVQAASKNAALDPFPGVMLIRQLQAIHARWHRPMYDIEREPEELMSFHWRLRTAITNAGLIRPLNVPVLTRQHVAGLGLFDIHSVPIAQSVQELREQATEVGTYWHADAHEALQLTVPEGVEASMTNLSHSILLPQFWALHRFIDDWFVDRFNALPGMQPGHSGRRTSQQELFSGIENRMWQPFTYPDERVSAVPDRAALEATTDHGHHFEMGHG